MALDLRRQQTIRPNPNSPMKTPSICWSDRRTAIVLILLQPLIGWPLYTLAAEGSSPKPTLKSLVVQSVNLPLPSASQESPAPTVIVNRTVPQVEAPSGFKLGQNPSDEEITRCGLFSEPLVPMMRSAEKVDNLALSSALNQYATRNSAEDVSALTGFCAQYPQSRWRVALLYNLAKIYYFEGYYSKALASWEEAWDRGETATDAAAIALVNQAFAELGRMNARLGRTARLEALLKEGQSREFLGSSAQEVVDSKDALALMKHDPDHSFRCGPLALAQIRASQHLVDPVGDQKIRAAKSTSQGCSLLQVANLAESAGMKYQAAKRDPGTPLITPAVVHWKLGHYAALVKEDHGKYLAKDLTFNNNLWLSGQAIEEEASGYFLVPEGPLPTGWHPLAAAQVADIWGCGATTGNQTGGETTDDSGCGCGGGGGGGGPTIISGGDSGSGGGDTALGMALYDVKTQACSLTVFDTPVGYHPPVGLASLFTLRYQQRADGQPATFTFSNVGQNWFHDWMAYVVDDPTNPGADVTVFPRGGGYFNFTGFDSSTQSYALELSSNTTLVLVSATSYERRFGDGSKEIYAQPNHVTGAGRQVFLTALVDAQGNSLTFSYDKMFRLVAVTDAIGQVSTLSYALTADPYKITKVTDPFGRTAKLAYSLVSGFYELTSITDEIGLISSFQYQIGLLHVLTTPYGQTTFLFGQNFGYNGTGRSVDIFDPSGGHQRIEYNQTVGYPSSDPVVPSGMNLFNQFLNDRDTFYWDQHAMEVAPYDYTQATVYHFAHAVDDQETSRLVEATGRPLESRIWNNYPGQSSSGYLAGTTIGRPSLVGRVLDSSGTTQLSQYSYNAQANVTSVVDPAGRMTRYTYAANGIDVVKVQHYNGSSYDTVQTAVYNNQHLPNQVTDAAGQITKIIYNSFGERTSVTDPKNETTTYHYDKNGFLQKVVDALGGTQAAYTYDGFNRVRTYTDVNGYTVTYSYDNLDRITAIQYPDTTTDTYTYQAMSLVESKDRLGRITHYTYNSLQQLIEALDPAGRKTQYEYCACGALTGITDGKGNITTFIRDVEDRVTQKIYADNSVVNLNYDFGGRLTSIVDAKSQTATYQYGVDNLPEQVTYAAPTPSVTLTYDAYARVASMTDGLGTSNYSYVPAGQLGALQIASEAKPTGYGTINYQYDKLSRVVNQSIDTDSRSLTYDAIGRVTKVSNGLGAFTYLYVGSSTRLQSVADPNSQTFNYQYYDATNDFRLQQIQQSAASAVVSNQYTYDAVGNILSWAQQNPADGTATWQLSYDADNEIQKVISQASNTSSGLELGNGSYAYDHAANLTKFTGSSSVPVLQTALYKVNHLNQAVSESGAQKEAISYDANGNPLNGNGLASVNPQTVAGARTYAWDGANRLIQITYPGTRNSTSLSYDGLSRLVRVVETENGATQSDERFVWSGNTMLQQRNSAGAVVKEYFDQGFLNGTTAYYYGRDQLGSIHNLTDAAGTIQTQLDYGLYGELTELTGATQPDFAYTGLFYHQRSGLYFAEYRSYDSGLKRWLNRDPIRENGGINLFTYVSNNPLNLTDPTGLEGIVDNVLRFVEHFGKEALQPDPNPIGINFIANTYLVKNIDNYIPEFNAKVIKANNDLAAFQSKNRKALSGKHGCPSKSLTDRQDQLIKKYHDALANLERLYTAYKYSRDATGMATSYPTADDVFYGKYNIPWTLHEHF
jgi:RHS repeat-associated protein